jgi:hypothetical protein
VPASAFDRPSKPLVSTAVSPLMTASPNFRGRPRSCPHLQRDGAGRGRADLREDAVDLERPAERLQVDVYCWVVTSAGVYSALIARNAAAGGDLAAVAVGEGRAAADGVDRVVERSSCRAAATCGTRR